MIRAHAIVVGAIVGTGGTTTTGSTMTVPGTMILLAAPAVREMKIGPAMMTIGRTMMTATAQAPTLE